MSLQDRPTLVAKFAAIGGSALGSIAAIVMAGLLCHKLVTYHTHGAAQYMMSDDVLYYCPSESSFFLVNGAIVVAFALLASLFHLLATAWIIFQRTVFLSPPPGAWDDPDELKALNWICTSYGDVIPTIYMLPPSVHRLHREVNMCILYSHGNAMDLVKREWRLRAVSKPSSRLCMC